MVRAAVLAILLILTSLLIPTSSASLVPSHSFSGQMSPVEFNQTKDAKFGVVTGAADLEGTTTGLFAFSRAQDVTVHAGRAEVYDTSRTPEQAYLEYESAGTPIFHSFENVTITYGANATFIAYSGDHERTYESSSPFSIGLAVQPPANFASFNDTLKVGTSLALIGENSIEVTTPEGTLDDVAFLYSVTATTTFTAVEPQGDNESFEGTKWLVILRDGLEITGSADTLLVPFEEDGNATFRPAGAGALRSGLDVNRIAQGLAELQGKDPREAQPPLDEDAQSILNQLAPILNGALIGTPDENLTIGGQDRSGGFIHVLRFSSLHVSPAQDGRLSYEGSGRFLLADNQLHTTKATIGSPPFSLPVFSLVLWVFAAGAIVAGFMMKPFATPSPALAAFPIRIVAIAFHIVCLILLFVLWDMEIKSFLGTSLLTGLGNGAGIGLATIAALQLIPLGVAATLFGLPVRFIINGVLRVVNMKKARGIGRGLGNLATWGLGAAFIPVILNPVLQMLLSRLT